MSVNHLMFNHDFMLFFFSFSFQDTHKMPTDLNKKMGFFSAIS